MRSIVFALLMAASSVQAASLLPQAFTCGTQGTVGGLGAGVELTRYVVDVKRYPQAICNDGTPAIFYYAEATRPEDRDKWLIFLQGGGSCVDGQSCAQRWCSIETAYGMDKMTTSLSKPQIRANGFLTPESQNRFGTWNRVLIFYCSSDTWSGDAVRTVQATLGNGTVRDYDIYFKGSRIIDAVIDTLRNASPRRRVVRHDVPPWPDLDDATDVLFGGASAGGAGVRTQLDRVADKLRASNPDADVRGVMDASYLTMSENRDFAHSKFCALDPARGCSYETFAKAARDEIDEKLYGGRGDESCAEYHAAFPGTDWRCGDGEHVQLNHLSTPFFIHQDLQDENISADYAANGFGTVSDYARTVEDELRNLQVPEEPRGATPGRFVPQCTHHEGFTDDEAVFRVKLAGTSWHDAVWNWWNHAQPQVLVRPFTGTPGRAPECP